MQSAMNDWNALLNRNWTPKHQAVRVAFANAYVTVQSLGVGADILITHDNPETYVGSVLGTIAAGGNVFLGSPKWNDAEWIEFSAILKPHAVLGETHLCVKLSNEKPKGNRSGLWMIPSGGSSGRLKFVIHTTESLRAACKGLARCNATGSNRTSALPVYHASGLMPALRTLFTGGIWIPLEGKKLDAGEFPHIENVRDFNLSVIPTQLARWMEWPEGIQWLKSFHCIFVGASACPKSLVQKSIEADLPIRLVYGMTETAAMILLQDPTTGKTEALPHTKLTFSEPDEDGWRTLSVSSSSLFCGYFPDISRLHETSSPSDLFRLDAEGNILEIRRADRVIITGGKKVDPTEVEQALLESGLVHAAHVFGEAHPEWGQRVVAWCVPTGDDVKDDVLKEYLKNRLAAHKVPKRYELMAVLPYDERGKLRWS